MKKMISNGALNAVASCVESTRFDHSARTPRKSLAEVSGKNRQESTYRTNHLVEIHDERRCM